MMCSVVACISIAPLSTILGGNLSFQKRGIILFRKKLVEVTNFEHLNILLVCLFLLARNKLVNRKLFVISFKFLKTTCGRFAHTEQALIMN